ncbi:MAG: hypothetical protein MHM6MM_000890 [Cercozoa sp. M6MM]
MNFYSESFQFGVCVCCKQQQRTMCTVKVETMAADRPWSCRTLLRTTTRGVQVQMGSRQPQQLVMVPTVLWTIPVPQLSLRLRHQLWRG